MEITRDNHDFALEFGLGEVRICDLEFCHIALLEILCRVWFKVGGRYSLRGVAPPHIVKTPLTVDGVWSRRFARTETRYLQTTTTIPTHMLPEEGRNAYTRYACRVQARRVELGAQSDHMERLVGGARPKRAAESSRLPIRGLQSEPM